MQWMCINIVITTSSTATTPPGATSGRVSNTATHLGVLYIRMNTSLLYLSFSDVLSLLYALVLTCVVWSHVFFLFVVATCSCLCHVRVWPEARERGEWPSSTTETGNVTDAMWRLVTLHARACLLVD